MSDLTKQTIGALAEGLRRGQFSSVDLTQACLDQIKARGGDLLRTVTAQQARKCAAQIDQDRQQGRPLDRLAGIPMAAGDDLCTRGVRTSAGSLALDNFIAPYDAHAMEKIGERGAVLLGKLSMGEFGMDEEVPSSGAAAVAQGLAPYALISDDGGDLRQSAARQGVVGIKPSYGAVSRYGLISATSSLGQIGPLAGDVRGAAMALGAIAGWDGRDSTSARRPVPDLIEGLEEGMRGLRIALPDTCFDGRLDGEIGAQMEAAAQLCQKLGAQVRKVPFASLDVALSAHRTIAAVEASSNLSRYDGIKYGRRAPDCQDIDQVYERSRGQGFGAAAKRGILLGTFALSGDNYRRYYQKALEVRTLVLRDLDRIFAENDLMLCPVCPAAEGGDRLYTAFANLAGLPAMSLPCGVDRSGRPVGMQWIGRAFEEALMLRAARAYERERDERRAGQ